MKRNYVEAMKNDGVTKTFLKEIAVFGIGVSAILSLARVFSILPPQIGFFIISMSVILFPGFVVTRLLLLREISCFLLPEKLSIWFSVGMGINGVIALVCILLHAKLVISIIALSALYLFLILLHIILWRKVVQRVNQRKRAHNFRNDDGLCVRKAVPIILVAGLGIGASFVTLFTPRDYDDWFYTAYIADFVQGKPIGLEDAIFEQGAPPERIWFGGAVWVIEAIFSKVSGLHPVDVHQTYFPLFLLPFVTFATLTMARSVFDSLSIAVTACFLQMLFYLSSVFPYKSAGWFVFCRAAQDKSIAAFIIAPVATALALHLLRSQYWRRMYLVFITVLITSILVHPMGPLWIALLVLPMRVLELAIGNNVGKAKEIALLLPFAGFALALIFAQNAIKEFITAPPQPVSAMPAFLSNIYLPGSDFGTPLETLSPLVYFKSDNLVILNPLFVTRFPIALIGLMCCLLGLRDLRSNPSARFIVGTISATLVLVFTPPGVFIFSRFIHPRQVFRAVLVLPWGLAIGYVFYRIKVRPLVAFAVVAGLSLGMAKGNPRNYVASFESIRHTNRPQDEIRCALEKLNQQPSPQGRVLAPGDVGRMIPAFAPNAYPLNFRERGALSENEMKEINKLRSIDQGFVDRLRSLGVRYILVEKRAPLADALRKANLFKVIYENNSIILWQTDI